MQHYILHDFTDSDLRQARLEIGKLSLNRYDNPFESKSFLENKADLLEMPALSWMLDELRTTPKTAQRLLNLPISHADWQHYGGLFVYNPGDFLAPHVDAGAHPKTGQRKVATICLYLTDAILSFWSGDSCLETDPEVWLESPVNVRAGEAVLFPNHDQAWHSVPRVQSSSRACMTLSYMAHDGFSHPRYQNPRTRAYFARRHGVPDTPEIAELRRKRASEEDHQEVYRVER